MADNVAITAGSGTNIATDDAGAGGHVQIMKLATSTDGSATVIPASTTDGLLVNLGTNNDITGTVTANLAAGTNNIGDVDVLSVPAPLSTTGTGTEATALRVTIATDSTGLVSVDDNGASLTIDAPVGTPAFVRLSDGASAITTLPVSLASLPTLAAGTANIGDVDVLSIAAGDNNIGNVDIVTMPNVTIGTMAALVAGTANIGDVDVLTLPNVTLAAGTNTNEVVGDVAHSAGVAGNPLTVGGVSIDVDDTAPPNRVDAEADATRLGMDRDGSVFVRTHGPQLWSYHLNTSSAQTDTTVKAAPAAGLSHYITSITFSSGAATAINAFFEEGASTVLGPFYLEAVAGRGMHLVFPTPKKITAATALTVTTSAAIAHSIEVMGFTAQG